LSSTFSHEKSIQKKKINPKNKKIQAKKIGVDVEELLVCQPDSGEQALEIADMMVQSGMFLRKILRNFLSIFKQQWM
jgi:hypothetical protein